MRIFWLFIFLINLSCSNINNKKDVKEIKKTERKTFKCESLNDCTDILYNRMIKSQYEIIAIKRLERRKFLVKVDNSPYGLKSIEIDLDECCR